jgi:2-polyprenyl-3-methyl-5-hydroxy-6-metoxy-1,4-benzoquinol methylase
LNRLDIKAEGIELNSEAIKIASDKGIPVSQSDLHMLAKEKSGSFDAVCAFQVLEHIAEPLAFLESLIQLIKPGGKVIISVPNSDSFAKHDKENLLDLPPHHMTRWSEGTFRSLPAFLSIKLERVKVEPLAQYHVDWYILT